MSVSGNVMAETGLGKILVVEDDESITLGLETNFKRTILFMLAICCYKCIICFIKIFQETVMHRYTGTKDRCQYRLIF